MYNTLISLLVLKEILSYEEGEAIADKLNSVVVPAKFKDAYADLEKALSSVIKQSKK